MRRKGFKEAVAGVLFRTMDDKEKKLFLAEMLKSIGCYMAKKPGVGSRLRQKASLVQVAENMLHQLEKAEKKT